TGAEAPRLHARAGVSLLEAAVDERRGGNPRRESAARLAVAQSFPRRVSCVADRVRRSSGKSFSACSARAAFQTVAGRRDSRAYNRQTHTRTKRSREVGLI